MRVITQDEWVNVFESSLRDHLILGESLPDDIIFQNRIKSNLESLFSGNTEMFIRHDLTNEMNFLADLLITSKKQEIVIPNKLGINFLKKTQIHYESLDVSNLVSEKDIPEFNKQFDQLADFVGVSNEGYAKYIPDRPVELLTARNYVFITVFNYINSHKDVLTPDAFFQFYNYPVSENPRHFYEMCFIADTLKNKGVATLEQARFYTDEQWKEMGLTDAMKDEVKHLLEKNDLKDERFTKGR